MELREVQRRVRVRPWLVPAFAALGTAISLIYALLAPKVYVANSQVFLGARAGDGSQASDVSPVQLKSYAMAVTSNLILDPAAKALSMKDADDLRDLISVSVPTGTSIIDVEADSSDPQKAASAANAVVSAVLAQGSQLYPINNRGQKAVQAKVLSPATSPAVASSPKRTFALVVGFVLGTVIGLLAALIVNARTYRPRLRETSVDEVANANSHRN